MKIADSNGVAFLFIYLSLQ